MKKMKRISAVAVFLMTVGTYANSFVTTPSAGYMGTGAEETIKEGPFFRKAGDKLFLNFLNRELGDVQIKVIDSDNRVLYSETLKSTLVVEKAFNFAKAEKDSYKVLVKDANDTYAEYYVVK